MTCFMYGIVAEIAISTVVILLAIYFDGKFDGKGNK